MGAGSNRSNGFEVKSTKEVKPTAIMACTASTRARNGAGKLPPNSATAPPNSTNISNHNSNEPSWLPQTPEILYSIGLAE